MPGRAFKDSARPVSLYAIPTQNRRAEYSEVSELSFIQIQIMTKTKAKKGLAALSPERRRKIASLGGKAQGKHNNPGNFANNRKLAVRAGKKGGKASNA